MDGAGAWRSLAAPTPATADGGPTGTWLLATDAQRTSAGTLPVRIWRWGARGFERPQTIGALARNAGQGVGGAQDTNTARARRRPGRAPARRLAAGHQACGGQQCIVYRRTDRRGFGPQIIYPRRPGARATSERFSIAANSGGSGWLVWDDLSDRIRAVPLVTPPLGSRVGSRRIGPRRVTVPDFYGCVPPGGRFVHRLRVDGRRGTPIVSVRFFFDAGQPARTDHRAPWRIDLPAEASRRAPGTSRRRSSATACRARRTLHSARIGRTFVMC